MTRSGPGAGRSARRSGAPARDSKVLKGLVALGLARHMLRSRRFQERVVVTAIALEALRGIGKENRDSMMTRLSAWNKRQVDRLERETERQVMRLEAETERQARAVKGTRQMARSGRPRRLQAVMQSQAKGSDQTADQSPK
jgi:hypothetical protein